MQHRQINNLSDTIIKPKTGLKEWKVHKELNHSDHNTIKFKLETEMETIPVHRPWNKADWTTFKKELENKEIDIPNKITPHRLEKIGLIQKTKQNTTTHETNIEVYAGKNRKKHERDQTEAMGNETEMSHYLNKILKNKAKKDIGTLKKSNGEYTIPGLDTLEELANKHYPTHTHR